MDTPAPRDLRTLADDLYTKIRDRKAAEIAAWRANQDADKRRVILTPLDGWIGKNQEQREATMRAAFAADDTLRSFVSEAEAAHEKAERLTGEIDALETLRRAEEWRIRARLIEALEARVIQPNGRGDRVESAFDDTLQHQADAVSDDLPF